MTTPVVGLLPLFIELYDRAVPESRPDFEAFYHRIADALETRGLRVIRVPVCRLEPEFAQAVEAFESAGADAIVSLHLAYSPSLESAGVLARTSLPIIVLDTTPAYAFGPAQSPDAIMTNHGIHGVQDLCNLLIRSGKSFQIEAGHWEKSDVLDRVTAWALAARMARTMRTARIGLIGGAFAGMGDFQVPAEVLKTTIGVEIVLGRPDMFQALLPDSDDPMVAAEMQADGERFVTESLDEDAHRIAVRTGLAIQRWIEQEGLLGFSVNFLTCDQRAGLPTVPFLGAEKAMARGFGYAGEGDVLTAALVGTLARHLSRTTFTEMFCPDWAGNTIFLSHMGEVNPDLVAGKARLLEKPFPWTDAANPVCAVGRLCGGPAVLVNLAPGLHDSYTLIITPVEMVDVAGPEAFGDSVRGWLRPAMPIADFLEGYSQLGGTHHSALVYGDVTEEIARFGELMGWDVAVIGEEH